MIPLGLHQPVSRETAKLLETRMDIGGPAGTRTQDQRIMRNLLTGQLLRKQRVVLRGFCG